MKTQLVLVEFDNCAPFLYRITSEKKITLKRVVAHFEETEGFSEERGAITFVDEASVLCIDKK